MISKYAILYRNLYKRDKVIARKRLPSLKINTSISSGYYFSANYDLDLLSQRPEIYLQHIDIYAKLFEIPSCMTKLYYGHKRD